VTGVEYGFSVYLVTRPVVKSSFKLRGEIFKS